MFNLLFGIFATCFGLCSLFFYATGKTEKFGKLEPMKKFWGEKLGKAIHFTGYVVAPIAVGVTLLVVYLIENNIINL